MNILLLAVFAATAIIAAIGIIWMVLRRKARRMGYDSLNNYLHATPQSTKEKKDAIDMSLKGVVICVLGLAFPPLLLLGIIPLYFGIRKLAYAAMGFGLFEDTDPPGA